MLAMVRSCGGSFRHTFIQITVILFLKQCINGQNPFRHHSNVDLSRSNEHQVFDTFAQVSLNTCIETCKQTTACTHINYNRLMKLCYLIEQSGLSLAVTIATETKGMVLGVKADWDMVRKT